MRLTDRRTGCVAVLALAASSLVGCAAPETPSDSPEDVGTAVSAITATQAITRAEEWVSAQLLYCQSPNGANDSIDPSCSPVCHRQSNPAWDPYRSDCSGLVSWAWGLPAPGRTTAEFAPNESDITHTIDASTLTTGDAVNTDDSVSDEHHVMLFKAWTTPGQEATFIEEPGCSANPDYAHEFTSTVTLSGTSITVHYNGITFRAIRYANLDQSATYAASYVSQSWPLSSAPAISMTAGQMQTGSIDMKNTGTATWKAGNVKLAPIPRDKPSDFKAPSWLSPTRVSTIAADVPPGATGHFEWDLDPSMAGDFQPYFGLVAEGITWFADSGGPPDNDIQVSVHVAPAPPTGSSGAGGASGTGGAGGDVGNTGSSANSGSGVGSTGSGKGGDGNNDSGAGGQGQKQSGSSGSTNDPGGCRMSPGSSPAFTGIGLFFALLLMRRKR